jgi:23S rRNA pseudouridine2605 synthase
MKREAKGSGKRTVNKSGDKPAFAKKGRPSASGRGFTKKSEMKGWNKKSDDKPVDYRFAKPGSKGKDIDFSKKRTGRTPVKTYDKDGIQTEKPKFERRPGVRGKDENFSKKRTGRTPAKFYDKEGASSEKSAFDKRPSSRGKEIDFSKKRTGRPPAKFYDKEGVSSEKPAFDKSRKPVFDKETSYASGTKSTRPRTNSRGYNATESISSERGNYSAKPERTKPFNKFSRIAASKSDDIPVKQKKHTAESDLVGGSGIRLNRYISNAGICSRREADELINAGLVSVNDNIVTTLGTKVIHGDVVKFNGSKLSVEERVYVLLNKPKDTITTFDDPEGRNTVMELFEGKMKERIFPVGRLDRNTTGVLLLTNDGELAQRLMHPKYEVFKVYRATLDKPFKPTDMWTLSNGIVLEDGPIKPDAIAMSDPKDKKVVGVEIHSGKNRIIHRMFEHLEYKVDRLDRVLYADLEKGKLKRGEWRHLTEKEVKSLKRLLKMK